MAVLSAELVHQGDTQLGTISYKKVHNLIKILLTRAFSSGKHLEITIGGINAA